MKYILLLSVLLGSRSCTDSTGSQAALEAAGMTSVRLYADPSAHECPAQYVYSTKFTAYSQQGAPVYGVVCCGYWKDCDIRVETKGNRVP